MAENNEYVELELELPDWAILYLALQAHKKDITLNQHMNDILREHSEKVIADHKSEDV